MKSISITLLGAISVTLWATVARADDAADVKAAEVAFNTAQNAGNIVAMFKLSLPDRTIFGANGGQLGRGWTEEAKRRRQAEFDAGRKVDCKIQELEARIFGNTAVTTFYRTCTIKNINEAPKSRHFRISGVWVRQADGWRLAHRHESLF